MQKNSKLLVSNIKLKETILIKIAERPDTFCEFKVTHVNEYDQLVFNFRLSEDMIVEKQKKTIIRKGNNE
jgi:hypothetical protein